jgi:hypothetical protein
VRGAGHREYDAITPCWNLDAAKIGASVPPRLDGTTGSIELGIFDESERDRTKVSHARSRVRTARRSWPLSARLLVGAMLVLNILLAAFLLRTEMKRPEARPEVLATSTPLTLERPKAGSSPQFNTPPNAPPDRASSPNQGFSPDGKSSPDQGSSLGLKTPPVEVRPTVLPSTQRSKRPPIKALPKALRASKTPRPFLLAPMPRAAISHPPEPLAQTPAPVRNPAASSGTSANVAPPGLAASIPAARVPGNAGTRPSAPAASGQAPSAVLAPSAIARGLAAKGNQPGSTVKVGSVGLPAVEQGLVKPTMPVARTPLKIEIVPRPPRKVENCGDDKVFIACPELKIRYDTPYTSEAPEAP